MVSSIIRPVTAPSRRAGRALANVWRSWPWTRRAGAVLLLMGLGALPLGAEEGLTEVALRSPDRASALVVSSHEGGDFATKNPRFFEVEFQRPDGRVERVRVGRVELPLAETGDRIEVEYGEARWFGLVAQQAGYDASFARAWIVLVVSAGLATSGLVLITWSLIAAAPAPRPPPPHERPSPTGRDKAADPRS